MRWKFLSIRSLAAGLLLCACGEAGMPAQSREIGPLAQRLLTDVDANWRVVTVPGVRLHFMQGGVADREAAPITDSVAVIRRELLALLGASAANDTASPAQLFFVNSRDDMRRLAGRPLVGFVQQNEPTGVFVQTAGYRYATLLRHELAHLYSFRVWGAPRAGRWLVEGLAVWAAGPCQEHSPDELAAGALARRALIPLTDLAINFDRVAEDVAMPQAGSIVGFLVRREGLSTIRHRWDDAPRAGHPLGGNGLALEAAWLAELSHVRPASLDIPHLISDGC